LQTSGTSLLSCVWLRQCSNEHSHSMGHISMSVRIPCPHRPDEQPSSPMGRQCWSQPVPGLTTSSIDPTTGRYTHYSGP
jgi:hypothetical protein